MPILTIIAGVALSWVVVAAPVAHHESPAAAAHTQDSQLHADASAASATQQQTVPQRSPLIEPVRPDVRPSNDRDDSQPTFQTPLLREGSFLTQARGRLLHDAEIGFWIFETEPDHVPTTPGFRVPLRFIMLPSTKLQQMQRTIEETDAETVFELTSRVFVYDDHNFILPIDAAIAEQRSQEVVPGVAQDTAETDDPEAEDLIASIRRDVPIARALAPADDEHDADARPGEPMTEGRLIVARRGRVVRTARGGWEFIFTADADGAGDAPMTILPCMLLEQMQRDALRPAARDSLLVSGEVYTYRGRNYLLPTLYQIHSPSANLQR